MTIIEQIKTEIERRKGYISVTHFAEDLLSFLSTLESEKPMNQDGLEEEVKAWHKKHFKSRNAWEDYSGHYLDKNSQLDLARHFAKWGAEHLADARKTSPKDLEEAAIEWSKIFVKDECKDACHYGFLTGAKWMADHTPLPEDTVLFNKGVEEGKRLMMEEAVSIIESRISEIIGDAQPKPALRAELEELIKQIKEDKK